MTTLFDPLKLGDLILPNRIIMAPLTRSRAGAGRIANHLMAEYYAQRASAGLILSEATVVSPMGIGYADTPGIWSPEQVEGLEAHDAGRASSRRTNFSAAVARGPGIRSELSERRAAGGAERRRRQRQCQPGAAAHALRGAARARSQRDSGHHRGVPQGRARTRSSPASTASNCMGPTAICWTSFCRTARICAPMITAARSKTARGCCWKRPMRPFPYGAPGGSACIWRRAAMRTRWAIRTCREPSSTSRAGQLRFAVHRPGFPAASPRSHGVPRRDVPGRVHVSVAGVPAGSAPEDGLALARLPVHLPARRAPLARERGTDLLHPAGRLLLQAAHQQPPPRSQDAPVQPGLRADVPAGAVPGALRGPGHRPDPQVLHLDHVEPARDIGACFLGSVLTPVGLLGAQPGDGMPDPRAAVRSAPGAGQLPLQPPQADALAGGQARDMQQLTGRQGGGDRHAPVAAGTAPGTPARPPGPGASGRAAPRPGSTRTGRGRSAPPAPPPGRG